MVRASIMLYAHFLELGIRDGGLGVEKCVSGPVTIPNIDEEATVETGAAAA